MAEIKNTDNQVNDTTEHSTKAPKKSMLKKSILKKVEKEAEAKKVAAKKRTSKKAQTDEQQPEVEVVNNEKEEPIIAAENPAKPKFSDAVVVIDHSAERSGAEDGDITIEKKLESLYKLQYIDSKIDSIRITRGELPLEVQDLEDEVVGLETRLKKYKLETKEHNDNIKNQQAKIASSQELIKRYEDQKMNVRNNREYDSLNKEVEYQGLEIELAEKKINDSNASLERLKINIEHATNELNEKKEILNIKKTELDGIIIETEKDEQRYMAMSNEYRQYIEDRLLAAYERIRKAERNGLAVVTVERGACAGCFNKIPPQRQLEIKMRKKIIVCEFCGRILVDEAMAQEIKEEMKE